MHHTPKREAKIQIAVNMICLRNYAVNLVENVLHMPNELKQFDHLIVIKSFSRDRMHHNILLFGDPKLQIKRKLQKNILTDT